MSELSKRIYVPVLVGFMAIVDVFIVLCCLALIITGESIVAGQIILVIFAGMNAYGLIMAYIEMTEKEFVFWAQHESKCVGICDSQEEFDALYFGLVEQITEDRYFELVEQGYEQ